jgi:DNA gyrase subunit A
MSARPFKFMDIESGDRLIWVNFVTDASELILVTYQGQAIRFSVDDVRPTGLGAGGMRAIKLQGQRDRVVGAGIADEQANVWVCTDTGIAKSTPVVEYPVQGRGGQGVITAKLPKDAGGLTAASVGWPDDNIVLVTSKGKPKFMRIGLAPEGGRSTKGNAVIAVQGKETVAHVVKLEARIEVPEDGFSTEDSVERPADREGDFAAEDAENGEQE